MSATTDKYCFAMCSYAFPPTVGWNCIWTPTRVTRPHYILASTSYCTTARHNRRCGRGPQAGEKVALASGHSRCSDTYGKARLLVFVSDIHGYRNACTGHLDRTVVTVEMDDPWRIVNAAESLPDELAAR
jgi:hypothetical protein